RRQRSIIAATASCGPISSASTEPSRRFRTQPRSPRRTASSPPQAREPPPRAPPPVRPRAAPLLPKASSPPPLPQTTQRHAHRTLGPSLELGLVRQVFGPVNQQVAPLAQPVVVGRRRLVARSPPIALHDLAQRPGEDHRRGPGPGAENGLELGDQRVAARP